MRLIKAFVNLFIIFSVPIWGIPCIIFQAARSKRHRAVLTGKKWFWRA